MSMYFDLVPKEPALTLQAFCEKHMPTAQGVDVQRFIHYGRIRNLIRQVSDVETLQPCNKRCCRHMRRTASRPSSGFFVMTKIVAPGQGVPAARALRPHRPGLSSIARQRRQVR
jgi:hypothetical protein